MCHPGISLVLEQAIYHLGQQVKLHFWYTSDNVIYIRNILKHSEGDKTKLQKAYERGTIELHEFNPLQFGKMDVKDIYDSSY